MAPISPPGEVSEVAFLLNGTEVRVPNPDPSESLLSFLRRTARLKGTKAMCTQGGCGACTVTLSVPPATVLLPGDPELASTGANGRENIRGSHVAELEGLRQVAVNACLRPLCSVHGLAVTTVEGVGSVAKGLHPVQQAMVDHNASQCGFCTPGFAMSMYSLLQRKGELSPADVEGAVDGNICRCTGYRSILDAFHTLSCQDCPSGNATQASACGAEIEDLCTTSGRCVKASASRARRKASPGDSPEGAAELAGCKGAKPASLRVVHSGSGVTWRTVSSLEELFDAMGDPGESVTLVCGNTSTGVYPRRPASVLVDVSRVPEMRGVKVSPRGITLGGAVTLAELMQALASTEGEATNLGALLKHLRRVANNQVRNVGSVVGNLMMTRQHPEFPSDVATLLVACGASLAVALVGHPECDTGPVVKVDLLSFLQRKAVPAGVNSDTGIVVLSVHVPAVLEAGQVFLSYKVAQRAVNSHALVNAAFQFRTDPETGAITVAPVLVFGGIQPLPCRAPLTEAFLAGKSAADAGVVTQALAVLSSELAPDSTSKRGKFRATLARSFLYKGLLSTVPREKLAPDLVSSVTPFERPISTGQVSFDQGDPSEYPVSKPIHKLSEEMQTTGEAQYLDDIDHVGELHAVYVRSTVANAALAEVDASDALSLPGVCAFVSAASLAELGLSNTVSAGEELLASERVLYNGQPLGIIVASTPELAQLAAAAVKVGYADVQPPLLTVEDAVAAGSFFPEKEQHLVTGSFEDAAAQSDAVVSGTSSVAHQYHFTMETQRSVAVPEGDGCLAVYAATQCPAQVQAEVSRATGVPMHKMKVIARRLGGGYGGKATRSIPVALSAALACKITGKAVRLVLDLETNMQIVGGRNPHRFEYEAAVMKDGEILGIKMDVVNNQGAHGDFTFPFPWAVVMNLDNSYRVPTWDLHARVARTNLPACTFVRAPGTVEALFAIETVIEHVATSLGISPDAVRQRNLYSAGDVTLFGFKLEKCNIALVLDNLKASSSWSPRLAAVQSFNQGSRWVKRGLALVPTKYYIAWGFANFTALLDVYPDGTLSVAHAGVEMGQGMNVKVAQVASYALGTLTSDRCPMAGITVKETTTDVANGTSPTGASIGSEITCMATKGACDVLVERLRPVSKRLKMRNKGVLPTWQQLIGQAVADQVDLQALFRARPGATSQGPIQYVSFGAAVTEAEVDLLTGESRLLRSDLLLDCGKSLNPAIDIGQVQGAFVMGLGYLLTEEYDYDTTTGKLLSDSTWEYKPPSYADIPIDLRAGLMQNSDNPSGFLRSKASGEPPLAMACSALFAVRHALSAGKDEVLRRRQLKPSGGVPHERNSSMASDPETSWVALSAPATPERVCLAADVPLDLMTM